MSKYYKEIDKEIGMIDFVAYELKSLSKAFSETGNESVSLSLDCFSKDISKATESISSIVRGKINSDLERSQRGVGDVLNTLISKS